MAYTHLPDDVAVQCCIGKLRNSCDSHISAAFKLISIGLIKPRTIEVTFPEESRSKHS